MSLVLLLFAGALAAQTGAGQRNFPIDSIAIEGNKILSTPAILTVAGLQAGQIGNSDIFDAARDRLLACGYFDAVSYRYKPTAGKSGYEVTYTVQEERLLYPIRADALDAATDEIVAFLKTRDPLFTGMLPGTKQVIDRTSKEIESYLEAKNHSQRVAGRVVATTTGEFEIDFTPLRGLPAVAAVSFEGTKIISAPDLHNKIAEVAFGQPYTEDGFRVFLENQIRPLYEAKGYMHVTFPKITSAPAAEVTGVDVKVTVDEGEEYQLSRVTVGGSMAGDSERILKSARIPRMTVANFDAINEGADRVRDSMRHQGYLEARVTTDHKIDAADKTVEAIINVEAGPRYQFGKLTVLGLGLDGEAAIRRMWSVDSGAPFPMEYPNLFVSRVKEEGLFDNLAEVKAQPRIDRASHLVDVTVEFKYGADKPNKLQRGPGLRR